MDFAAALIDWIKTHLFLIGMITAVPAVIFYSLSLLVPWAILRLPEDFLLRPATGRRLPLPVALVLGILRNLAGALLVLAGFIMLFIPGPGLLTLLLGFLALDFPGKRGIELRLLALPKVFAAINFIRTKAGRARLLAPGSPTPTCPEEELAG